MGWQGEKIFANIPRIINQSVRYYFKFTLLYLGKIDLNTTSFNFWIFTEENMFTLYKQKGSSECFYPFECVFLLVASLLCYIKIYINKFRINEIWQKQTIPRREAVTMLDDEETHSVLELFSTILLKIFSIWETLNLAK